MRITPRRFLIGLPLTIAAIPLTYFTFLYAYGYSLVPQPVPASSPVPQLLAQALWAAAGGGPEPELRPLNPIGLFRYVRCAEQSQQSEDTQGRAQRDFDCQRHLPGLRLREHLAERHVENHNIPRSSFRGGAAALSTMLGFSGRWTKDDFLRTVAERADFGSGWRGTAGAARALFNRAPEELTLPEAALLAALAGIAGADPWCEPGLAADARNRVLSGMLTNGAIADAEYREAAASSLTLQARPADRGPCNSNATVRRAFPSGSR